MLPASKAAPPAETPTCNLCAGTGRYKPTGYQRHPVTGQVRLVSFEKHCLCPIGRAMSHAHWDVKAAEELVA